MAGRAHCISCREESDYAADLPMRCPLCGARGGMRTTRVSSVYVPDRTPRALRREEWAGRQATKLEEKLKEAGRGDTARPLG